MKGRDVPPRRPTITVEQAAQLLLDHPGLYTLTYRHQDRCPTIRSQRIDECTCGDKVETTLRRLPSQEEQR